MARAAAPLALLLSAVPAAEGHGSMTIPLSRQGGHPDAPSAYCPTGCYYTMGTNIPGEAVVNDPALRTERSAPSNRPWRAPGTSPVWSPCGRMCNNCFRPSGTDGRGLPPKARGQWQAGATVEVAWGINANHGGGYSYRLCPASEELTEECMQRTPLDFVGNTTWIQKGSDVSSRKAIAATRTSLGVGGSMWSKNPIPDCKSQATCPFPEPLPQLGGHTGYIGQFNIVDLVRVPGGLPAGDYVLGWRWDCEETPQVWQNCADVTVSRAGPAPHTPAPAPPPAPLPPTPAPAPPAPAPGTCTILADTQTNGHNLKEVKGAGDAAGCCDACGGTPGCVGFTFVAFNRQCWLKDRVDAPVRQAGVTSGAPGAAPPPAPAPPAPAPAPAGSPFAFSRFAGDAAAFCSDFRAFDHGAPYVCAGGGRGGGGGSCDAAACSGGQYTFPGDDTWRITTSAAAAGSRGGGNPYRAFAYLPLVSRLLSAAGKGTLTFDFMIDNSGWEGNRVLILFYGDGARRNFLNLDKNGLALLQSTTVPFTSGAWYSVKLDMDLGGDATLSVADASGAVLGSAAAPCSDVCRARKDANGPQLGQYYFRDGSAPAPSGDLVMEIRRVRFA